MNKYYSYPGIDIWDTDKWSGRVAPIAHLIEHIQAITPIRESNYVPSFDVGDGDAKSHPCYHYKLRGFLDPAIPAELKERGLTFHATSQGGKDSAGHPWFIVCPSKNIDEWKKLPVLVCFDVEDESSPLWMMRAVKRYDRYIDLLAQRMDFILAVLVNEDVGYDKIYFNIMQEFTILFPCDINNIYLDVSPVLDHGENLKDIPGFTYCDDNGDPADPDNCVMPFPGTDIPALDIVARWGNGNSLEQGLVVTYDMNEGLFNREWFLHSEVGKRMAQDMLYEYNYDSINDHRFLKEMEDKGFVYHIRYKSFGDRYTVAFPRQQFEDKEKIPLVVIVQEVYEGNEHLAVTAHSYLAEWLEIAAQGECALMFFALEDIVSNDRVVEMLRECEKEYPIDTTRIYATGHSHDGYFAYMMANHHPEIYAGIAILGNVPCPKGLNDKFDFSKDHAIINEDMPTLVVSGLYESRFPVDEDDKINRWLPMWKQVFRNHGIPARSDKEILDAFTAEDYTKRITCLPGDKFRTLWCDGIEHYIVDFTNHAGRDHLRVIRQQNMPHTVTPMMCTLSWDFLRRFKRDPETREIIELY